MDRLEDALQSGESSDDLVLLLRGGEDTSTKVLRQAGLLESRYTYRDLPARGISLFAAHDRAEELTVLESKLRTYPKFRRVSGSKLAGLALLLPTFHSPHWTALLQTPDGAVLPEEDLLSGLLDILGPVLAIRSTLPDRARRR